MRPGSVLIQNVHVGNKVIVGANSTVIRDVDDDMKVYGVVKGGKTDGKTV